MNKWIKLTFTLTCLSGLVQCTPIPNTEPNTPKYEKVLQTEKMAQRPDAQYALAIVLEGQRDYFSAFNWFQKSAMGNYEPAYIKVAQYYEFGLGIKKDTTKAEQWYQKALKNSEFELDAKVALQRLQFSNKEAN